MSFTYNLTTEVGKVRLYIGDTLEDSGILPMGRNFSDEEITFILSEVDNDIPSACVGLLRTASANWSVMVDTEMGPLSESYSQASRALQARADKMAEENNVTTGTSFATTVSFVRADAYAEAAADESG